MKAINKALQISAIVLAVAGLALFFVAPFAEIVTADRTYNPVGAELSFGGDVWRSAQILFCFILTVITIVLAVLTFKSGWTRFAAPAVALGDAIYLLVIALSSPGMFVDHRPLAATSVSYSWVPLTLSLVMFGAFAVSTAHLFLDDFIKCVESKGRLTLGRRFVKFIRDYKSEINKIVWPNLRDVAKNTLVVLILSALVGVFIWLVDWGLGALMDLISNAA